VADSLVIQAGATSAFAFTADQARTFAYFARTHVDPLVGETQQAKRPFKLVAINAGNTLVSLLIMGAILATW